MTTTTQEIETQLLEYINKKDSSVSFEQKKSDDLDFDHEYTLYSKIHSQNQSSQWLLVQLHQVC